MEEQSKTSRSDKVDYSERTTEFNIHNSVFIEKIWNVEIDI